MHFPQQKSRFFPTDEKMIEQDRKDLGGEGLKITYHDVGDGHTVVRVWKHGSVIRRIHRGSSYRP